MVLCNYRYETLVHCTLLIPVCSTADLDRKLSLRRDRDELIKQGIIKPPEDEMLVNMYIHVSHMCVYVHMYVCTS